MIRTLLIALFTTAIAQAAEAQCVPEQPPNSTAVCCSVNEHSQWTNEITCTRIQQAASACFKQGGEDYNPATGHCVKSGTASPSMPPPPVSPISPRQQLANAARAEFCGNKMSLIIHTLGFKSNGFSQEQTVEQLVQQYAYGPAGQVYQSSASAEATIRAWVADVYLSNKYYPGMDIHPVYDRCMIEGR